ncbi:SUN domain-containing protein 2 isoform X2 [Hyperolius riggenbachi]|uniref:SUN domain-containing protein 2 isoform X2 n=1 Tax=Hyperolius riggenbachi TaxID=752182 RepID=UPI0035A27E23
MMSRRSKRLLSTVDQENDKNSISYVDGRVLRRESPDRTLRGKISTVKHAPISQETTEHGYFSATSVYDSWGQRGLSSALKETNYEGIQLRHSQLHEGSFHISCWRNWTQRMKKMSSLLISYPGHVFGLLYWWLGTTWYRLTTSASLLDVFILTRSYNGVKKVLLTLLPLLILTLVGAGILHFYPFGLQGLISESSGLWKMVKDNSLREESLVSPVQSPKLQSDLISRMESLEERLQSLQDEQTLLGIGELASKPGSNICREEVIQIFNDLSSSKEEALKEWILQQGSDMTKNELRKLKLEQQGNLQVMHQQMHQMSKDVEDQILQLKVEVKSFPQSLKETLLQDILRLETILLLVQQDLETIRKIQADMVKQMSTVPSQINGLKDEVQSLFPVWLLNTLEPKNGGSGSLSDTFLHQNGLQNHLLELEKKILAGVAADKRQWTSQTHVAIDKELQTSGLSGVSREEVYEIVNRALERYSEDRIGLVDYALESSGASVVNTRCSETFETKTALLSLFGVPLWYQSQSPRVILQGLEEETQREGVLLGNFTYRQDGNPIQTFNIKGENILTYELVELKIQSNWGHAEYTCVYRFRVHGESEM